jgi:hypothetical protein
MLRHLDRTFRLAVGLLVGTLSAGAAEIALSGADPTQILTTNPPVFSFTVDMTGMFTGEYINESGSTFTNLIITGPADGINIVACGPAAGLASCTASLNTQTDQVSFFFFAGAGIANGEAFFIVARDFPAGETLNGTSIVTSIPEPATILLMLGTLGTVALLVVAPRNFLKLRD